MMTIYEQLLKLGICLLGLAVPCMAWIVILPQLDKESSKLEMIIDVFLVSCPPALVIYLIHFVCFGPSFDVRKGLVMGMCIGLFIFPFFAIMYAD